jgi:hypothetical protein
MTSWPPPSRHSELRKNRQRDKKPREPVTFVTFVNLTLWVSWTQNSDTQCGRP